MPPWHDALELSEECDNLRNIRARNTVKTGLPMSVSANAWTPTSATRVFFSSSLPTIYSHKKKIQLRPPKVNNLSMSMQKIMQNCHARYFYSFWLVFAVAFWTGHRLYCHAATSGQCHRAAVAPVQLHVSVSPSPSAQAGSRVSSGHPSVDKAVARASSMLSVWKCENVSVMSLAQS